VHILRQRGYEVETAENGLEALDKLSQESFDLVLLDIFMPLMGGKETLEIIRAHPDTANLSVVVISGQSDKEVVQDMAKLGVADYIVKPFDPLTVTNRLNQVFSKIKNQIRLPCVTTTPTPGKLPTLIIADQDANFRHFFVSTLLAKFKVFEAVNGAEAIMRTLQCQPDALFVGAQLGVLSSEGLVRKIRSMRNLRDLKIYAIAQKSAQDTLPAASLHDGVVARSFVPEILLRYVNKLFPVDQVMSGSIEQFIPLLQTALVSATEQAFGMMVFTEVARAPAPMSLDPATPVVDASVTLSSDSEKLRVTVAVKCARMRRADGCADVANSGRRGRQRGNGCRRPQRGGQCHWRSDQDCFGRKDLRRRAGATRGTRKIRWRVASPSRTSASDAFRRRRRPALFGLPDPGIAAADGLARGAGTCRNGRTDTGE
jgi:two-component system chemotaxis response regulator CheY